MYFLRWESKSWWWTPYLSSQTFWGHRNLENWQGIEVDGSERKSDSASPQRTWAEKCPEAKMPNKFGLSYQHKKASQRYNFQQRRHLRKKPPNVGNKEGGIMSPRQIMIVLWMECKKVALCYLGKLWLYHGWNIRRLFCATKTNYDCAADGMLKGGFVSPRQIVFVPRMVCKIIVLRYQGKSCFGPGRILENCLGVQKQSMLLSWIEG
jgi:hypothetical protein